MELKHKAALVAGAAVAAILTTCHAAFAEDRVDPASIFQHRFANIIERGYADVMTLAEDVPGTTDLLGYEMDFYMLVDPGTSNPLCLPEPIMRSLLPDHDALVLLDVDDEQDDPQRGRGTLVTVGNSAISSDYAEGWFSPHRQPHLTCSWAIIIAYPTSY